MNRFTWRSWIATPIAVLGLIAAIAATPPTATAASLTDNTTAIELVVVNHDVTVAINVTSNVAELQKLDGLNIAWRTEDTVLKIANDMANPANVVKLNDGTATINVTPTPVTDNTAQVANDTNFKMQTNISPQVGANSAINDMAVMGGNVLNPAAWLDNMSTNISPQATSRGGVVLASTAGGGWLESLAALLGGRLDGRVS